MLDEYKAVIENGTWKIVDCPPDVKPIRCKWVYRIKYNPYRTIDKYKERLVAKGFAQQKGLIMKKLLHQQQSGTQFKWYLHYHLKKDGKYINGCQKCLPQWIFAGRSIYDSTSWF
jgi:hypothetical protein